MLPRHGTARGPGHDANPKQKCAPLLGTLNHAASLTTPGGECPLTNERS
jgi:hypothetical protein